LLLSETLNPTIFNPEVLSSGSLSSEEAFYGDIELCIGGGLRTFRDLRSVPESGRLREQVENHRRACTQVLFLSKAELEFFHFLEMVKGWLVPSTGQKIPLRPGWYLQPQTIPLAENSFLQASNGAENTKEKSRQCFTCKAAAP
jgi:hypothetical protein